MRNESIFRHFRRPPRRSVRRGVEIGERIVRTIFGLVFCIIPCLVLWAMTRSAIEARTMNATWIRTPCVILAASVQDADNGHYTLSVRYRYEAGGETRVSTRYTPRSEVYRFDSVAERTDLLDTYREGASAMCLVNPDNPNEAVLRVAEGDTLPWFVYLFPLVFIAAGLSLAVSAWWKPGRRRRASAGGPGNPGSGDTAGGADSAHAGPLAIFPVLICGAFIAVGCGIIAFGLHQRARAAAARDWPLAEGVVERIEVKREWHSGSRGSGGRWQYEPYIVYAYEVDGVRRVNDRRGFTSSSSSKPDAARRFVAAHPVGSGVSVRVNPADPADSVLDAESGEEGGFASWFPIAFGAVFAMFGAGLLVAMFSSRPRGGAAPPPSAMGVLQRKGRGGEFVQTLVFAVLWCSVTALVGAGLLSTIDWPPKGEDWIPVVFIAVFSCIGVGMLVRALVLGCRMGGPHLEITCGRGFVARGTETLFSYRLAGGRVEDIDSLIVWIVGQREQRVHHRRENRFETVETFRSEVLRAMTPHEIGQGFFRVELPPDVAPSGRSADGTAIWELAVSGHCRNRAGFSDTYPVTVR